MAKGGKRVGSGPKRKPTELRVLEGTFRKDRHGGSPSVVGIFPNTPPHLSEAEKQLWEAFPKPVWIGETDVVAVNAAVSLFERVLRVQRAQGATPEAGAPLAFRVTHDGDGNERLEPKENPLLTLEIKLWGRLMTVLDTLGLTPSARTKMQAPKVNQDADDKWAGIL